VRRTPVQWLTIPVMVTLVMRILVLDLMMVMLIGKTALLEIRIVLWVIALFLLLNETVTWMVDVRVTHLAMKDVVVCGALWTL